MGSDSEEDSDLSFHINSTYCSSSDSEEDGLPPISRSKNLRTDPISTNPLRSFGQLVCECPNENHKLKLVAIKVILFFICKDLVNINYLQISNQTIVLILQYNQLEL